MDFDRMSDREMVTLVGQGIGPGQSSAAVIDSQRRLRLAIEAFSGSMQVHSQALKGSVEEGGRQTAELVTLTKQTSSQTDEVIRLTKKLETLTVTITRLTYVAAFFAGIQAIAIIVRFVRWSLRLP